MNVFKFRIIYCAIFGFCLTYSKVRISEQLMARVQRAALLCSEG